MFDVLFPIDPNFLPAHARQEKNPGPPKHSHIPWQGWDNYNVSRLHALTMIQPGSTVRFLRMPEWVASLPEESRRVFEFCLGRVYQVGVVDEQGLFVLNVSGDVDQRFGGFRNDIRLEAEFLEEML